MRKLEISLELTKSVDYMYSQTYFKRKRERFGAHCIRFTETITIQAGSLDA